MLVHGSSAIMEKGVIAKGQILTETKGQRWIVGTFIGLSGSAESYEAASYDDKEVTDYPLILRIMLQGDEPLPNGIQFYLDHAKPDDLNKWKRLKQVQHLGVPVLLGADSLKINDQNYKFMVTEHHGKDLWSLFLERGRKFEAHTVYKITLQIMNVLKYIHSKSYVHGDIKASNIVVDVATQNQIYLLNDQLTLHTVSDDQVGHDKTCNDFIVLLSRDAQMRGDMEMLFYNLVQWLGIELPWKKNFKDPSLVLKEKRDAFADVDKFLQSWSKKVTIPIEVCEYMKLLATMDNNDLLKYYESDSSPWRSSTYQRCWQKPYFGWRPMSRQADSSDTFRNFNQRDRAQSLSHCDLWYRQDVYGWSSQSPHEYPVWNYYQNEPVRETFRENSAYRQTTTARNSESNVAEDEMNEKYANSDRRGEDQQTGLERD